MLGAIIGDIMGSAYEANPIKTKDIPRFNPKGRMTDDSRLTFGVAKVLLDHYPFTFSSESLVAIQEDLKVKFSNIVRGDYYAGWGASFFEWARMPNSIKEPYNSYGNGSAMRISSVGWLAKTEEEVKILSKTVSEITHNHPEGLKGAEAIAMCIFLARQGKTKEEIKDYVIKNYYPRLIGLSYDLLLKYYQFDVSCQGSVPEAIFSFLISQSLEDAIKTAISLGGDSDTLAAMAGSIAEAYYQSEELSDFEQDFLDRVIDLHDENLIIQLHTVIHSPKFLRNRDI